MFLHDFLCLSVRAVLPAVLLSFGACGIDQPGSQETSSRSEGDAESGMRPLAAATATGECLEHTPPRSLGVCRRAQEGPLWCWAATAEMMLEYLVRETSKEDFAQWQMLQDAGGMQCGSDPCKQPVSLIYGYCNKAGWPFEGKSIGSRFVASTSSALRWEDLVSEMTEGRPVAYAWCEKLKGPCSDEDSQGHMVVVAGAYEERGVKKLQVVDPRPCCRGGEVASITYARYLGEPWAVHWKDYYCLRESTASGSSCPEYSPVELKDVAPADLAPYRNASPRAVAERVIEDALPNVGALLASQLSSVEVIEKQLGHDVDLSAKVVVGRELQRYELGLEELREGVIKPEDAGQRLTFTGVVVFPIEVEGKAIASIEVGVMPQEAGNSGGEWRLEGVGWPITSARVYNARIEYEIASGNSVRQLVEIVVPGVNERFVAPLDLSWEYVGKNVAACRSETGAPWFLDHPEAGPAWRSGETVLLELTELARAMSGRGVS